MEFNIYVPSYNRADTTTTFKKLEYCTYVVRKSEEEAYRRAGIESVLAVEDEKINSAAKAYAWIYANVPEDIICVCDDDITDFYYRVDTLDKIEDPTVITQEFERLGQIIADIGLGYLAISTDVNVMYYDRPFKFVGNPGCVRIYNRKCFKARDKGNFLYFADVDVLLQELLLNRIVLIANYVCHKAGFDVNSGGNNFSKSAKEMEAENEAMKLKWGKYYGKATDTSLCRIKVPR